MAAGIAPRRFASSRKDATSSYTLIGAFWPATGSSNDEQGHLIFQ